MPELPEIETVARGLRTHILGKTISEVVVYDAKKFKGTPKQLKEHVIGKKVVGIERRAKWLLLRLETDHAFIIHLKMTGQLLFEPAAGKRASATEHAAYFLGGHTMESDDAARPTFPNKHTRVAFVFSDKSTLYFQDMRRFGYVELYAPENVDPYFTGRKLALEIQDPGTTFDYFKAQLSRRARTTIKAALLNQSVVSGLGNIYVDDTLHLAKIHPTRVVGTLTAKELRTIYTAARKIINKAIDLGGTSFSSFLRVDGKLGQYWDKRRVYGRTGEPCQVCKTPIQKIRVAGRGTHVCPQCQQ
jgi:formamidopyrimidine-DNA glycosylase